MIFNKIFNTLRFNIALPSYLVKNKFIIERNNKFRNIFSTLNHMFKTSSWSFNNSINMDNTFTFKNFIKYILITAMIVFIFIYRFDLMISNHFIFILWKSSSLFYLILLNIYLYSFFIFKVLNDFLMRFFYKTFYIKKSWNKKELNTVKTFTYSKLNNINYSDSINSLIHNNFNLNIAKLEVSILVKNIYNILDLNINEVSPIKDTIINKFETSIIKQDKVCNVIENELKQLNVNLTDNTILTSNKLNFNFSNLKLNFIKNIEYYKWLYKYSLVHSRSFSESQYLNLKITPIGSNLNTYNNHITDNTVFNYYFNSLDSRFKLNLINLNFLNFVNIKFNNNLYNPNSWLQSFSSLMYNFKWYQQRYQLTNEFYCKILINILQLNNKLFTSNKVNKINQFVLISDNNLLNISTYTLHFKIFNLINNTSYYINLYNFNVDAGNYSFKNDLKKIIILNNEVNNN